MNRFSVFEPSIRRRQLQLARLLEQRSSRWARSSGIGLHRYWGVHHVTGRQLMDGSALNDEAIGRVFRWVGGRREYHNNYSVLLNATAVPCGGVYVWHRDDR